MTEIKKPEKKEEKQIVEDKFVEAKVNGRNVPISTKHSIAICDYIRGKDIEKAIKMLKEVKMKKKAIPMKGEIPHKKGMMGGRYCSNATESFIKLLNSLKANAIAKNMELEKYKIFAMANIASRPQRRFGRMQARRTNVLIKLIQKTK